MKGHIRERSRGRWAIILDVRDPATNKRKRRWHSFVGTKRAAQLEAARLIAEQQTGGGIALSKITVAEFLDRWLEHVATLVSPSSHRTYTVMMARYVKPTIGNVRLAKLKPHDVAALYAKLLQDGLAPKSVLLVHRVLAQALKQATRWQLLAGNPATAVKPPKIERREMQVPDTAATLALIEAARTAEIFPAVLVAALTGLRRGEVAALRWRDVSLDTGQLAVVASAEQIGTAVRLKPPKSGRGRTVALPALLVDELRRYRVAQAQHLLRLGVRQSGETFVCLRGDGSPWQPSALTAQFGALLRAHRLPRMRLHDLRHAHASHLLAANVPAKIVQERLGHHSVSLTLDLYSHATPGMQRDAAAALDAVMGAAKKG
jgi:integrase